MLIEHARPSATPEMAEQLAARLRLPSGFAEAPEDAAELARLLDVATRVVESQTRSALIRRRLALRRAAWDGQDRLTLPVGPVAAVEELALEQTGGARVTVDPGLWRLDMLGDAPAIVARTGRRLPPVPAEGFVEAQFVAGFADVWAEAPGDLRHAVIELAASYYDGADETAPTPRAVALLLERYRRVRL